MPPEKQSLRVLKGYDVRNMIGPKQIDNWFLIHQIYYY